MITRRAILGGLAGWFATGIAPAAIGSGVLMPVRKILVPAFRLDPPLFEMEIGRWDGFRFIETPAQELGGAITGSQAWRTAQEAMDLEYRAARLYHERVESILFPKPSTLWQPLKPTPRPS